jgi:hypothetical protein
MPRRDATEPELLDEDTDFTTSDLDGDPADAEYDGTQELRVNISEKEGESEGRIFEPLPGGTYVLAVTDGSVAFCGPNSKNPGKPYWRLETTVQTGPHEGRKLFTNVMLFEGALYTFVQLMKALGRPVDGTVPRLTEIVGTGEQVAAVVSKQKDDYRIKQDGWTPGSGEQMPMKNEIKNFMHLSKLQKTPAMAGKVTAKKGTDSDLE